MDKLILGDVVEVLREATESPLECYLEGVKPGMVGKVIQIFDFVPSATEFECSIIVQLENTNISHPFCREELQLW